MAAYDLSVMDKLPPDGWKPADRPEAERVLRGMAGDGERMFKEAIDHLKDSDAVLKKLKETYKTAQDALADLPPRAEKK